MGGVADDHSIDIHIIHMSCSILVCSLQENLLHTGKAWPTLFSKHAIHWKLSLGGTRILSSLLLPSPLTLTSCSLWSIWPIRWQFIEINYWSPIADSSWTGRFTTLKFQLDSFNILLKVKVSSEEPFVSSIVLSMVSLIEIYLNYLSQTIETVETYKFLYKFLLVWPAFIALWVALSLSLSLPQTDRHSMHWIPRHIPQYTRTIYHINIAMIEICGKTRN